MSLQYQHGIEGVLEEVDALHVRQFADEGDEIEAHGLVPDGAVTQIGIGGLGEVQDLLAVHSLLGTLYRIVRTSFHFYETECHRLVLQGDDVDVTVPVAPVSFQDEIALSLQFPLCDFLAPDTFFIVFCHFLSLLFLQK